MSRKPDQEFVHVSNSRFYLPCVQEKTNPDFTLEENDGVAEVMMEG